MHHTVTKTIVCIESILDKIDYNSIVWHNNTTEHGNDPFQLKKLHPWNRSDGKIVDNMKLQM